MTHPSDEEVTQLLHAWSSGDGEALERLIPLVYDDLHRMARYFFHREANTHTLQPTALVSEVYLRLRGQKKLRWESREDFFHFAADVMRHFLVDYARRRRAGKRGGGVTDLPIDTLFDLAGDPDHDVVDLDRALEALEALDPRQARIVKLRFFVGLKVPEVAEILDISPATIKREWSTAKLWLRRRLDEDTPV